MVTETAPIATETREKRKKKNEKLEVESTSNKADLSSSATADLSG